MSHETVDQFYRAWLGRDLEALAELLDDNVRWSTPPTMPGGGVRRGRRAVLEQAALFFARFPTVVVERMSTIVVGDWVTVRGRYRTIDGQTVDFVDRIHVREGRIAALRANMRADEVRRASRDVPAMRRRPPPDARARG
jgi:ketosteroid isomerase-like protein